MSKPMCGPPTEPEPVPFADQLPDGWCTCPEPPAEGQLHAPRCPMLQDQLYGRMQPSVAQDELAGCKCFCHAGDNHDWHCRDCDPHGTSFGYPNSLLAALSQFSNEPKDVLEQYVVAQETPENPSAAEKPGYVPSEAVREARRKLNFAAVGDSVNHPAHYGGDTTYEVIKVAEAWGLDRDAYLFSLLKYVGRPTKGDYLEDLKKARWYLDRKIRRMEQERDSVHDLAACGHGPDFLYCKGHDAP